MDLKRFKSTYSSRVFSDFSICSALLMTSTIICCSDEVNGSGCFHWLIVAVLTDQPEWSLNTDDDKYDNKLILNITSLWGPVVDHLDRPRHRMTSFVPEWRLSWLWVMKVCVLDWQVPTWLLAGARMALTVSGVWRAGPLLETECWLPSHLPSSALQSKHGHNNTFLHFTSLHYHYTILPQVRVTL